MSADTTNTCLIINQWRHFVYYQFVIYQKLEKIKNYNNPISRVASVLIQLNH
jgi:hypothetical protein